MVDDATPLPKVLVLAIIGGSGVILFILLSLIGWNEVGRVFDSSEPQIVFSDVTPGVGLAPVAWEVRIHDLGAGLDWYSVELKQEENVVKLVDRESLEGAKSKLLKLSFLGDRAGLEEGAATLSVVAADLGAYKNKGSAEIKFSVDFAAPELEVIYAPDSVLQGSTYFIFVKSTDNNDRLESGLKIGDYSFKAFPARWLDRAFDDPALYVIPFAIPLEAQVDKLAPFVFADDTVGNRSTVRLSFEIVDRSPVTRELELTGDFLKNETKAIYRDNRKEIEQYFANAGRTLEFSGNENTTERFLEYLQVVTGVLDPVQDERFKKILESMRFDRLWFKAVYRQQASIFSRFGTLESLLFEDKEVGTRLRKGYTLDLRRTNEEVVAVSDGVVHFVGACSHLHKCVIVDHGLGLVSLYGNIEQAMVEKGQRVATGDPLAQPGRNHISGRRSFYLELRIQGVPVEIKEWWSSTWFAKSVTGVTNKVKKSLGIPVQVGF